MSDEKLTNQENRILHDLVREGAEKEKRSCACPCRDCYAAGFHFANLTARADAKDIIRLKTIAHLAKLFIDADFAATVALHTYGEHSKEFRTADDYFMSLRKPLREALK